MLRLQLLWESLLHIWYKYTRWFTNCTVFEHIHIHTHEHEHARTHHITCTGDGVNKDADMNANHIKPCYTINILHSHTMTDSYEISNRLAVTRCRLKTIHAANRMRKMQSIYITYSACHYFHVGLCLHYYYFFARSWQHLFMKCVIIGMACIQSNLCESVCVCRIYCAFFMR